MLLGSPRVRNDSAVLAEEKIITPITQRVIIMAKKIESGLRYEII